MLESKEVLSITKSSSELNRSIEDFKGLIAVYGYEKIINDLINMAVRQRVSLSHQAHPFRTYEGEERELIHDIFDNLQTEIRDRIKASTSIYQVPQIEVTYKYPLKKSERQKVTFSKDVYHLFLHNWSDKIEFVEEFNVLFTDNGGHILGIFNVGKGGGNQVAVDARVIFAAALKANAKSIILAHNHPSGNPNPSQEDFEMTKKICALGKQLNIQILDHLIITPDDYYSFADEGQLIEES